MKVLHLGKYYPPEPGGIEYVLKHLIESTSAAFSNYAIVADRAARHWEETGPGYTIFHRRAVATLFFTPVMPGLFSFLHAMRKKHAVDCIVLHVPNPMTTLALFVSALFAPLREKIVVFYHADILLESPWLRFVYVFFRLVERRILSRADRIVATSPNMLAASGVLRSYGGKVAVVPLMVPDEWCRIAADEIREADVIREAADEPIILFVGRLIPYKDLDTLLEAVPLVPRGSFLIVGDGPLEGTLKRKAAALGVNGRVRFVGRVPRLKPYYMACDILVLPSNSSLEAFGLVQLEAMSFGKPVVTSDLPTGVTYANLDGRTGLTFPVGDSGKLGAALNRLIEDEPLRKRLGEQARERVRAEFLASAVGRRFERLLADVSGKGAAQ